MDKFFSPDPMPDVERAKLLLQNNREKVVISLNMLVDACEEILDTYYFEFLKRRLSNLAQGYDLNPMLFRISATLVQAVEAQDEKAARQLLQTLATLNVEEPATGTMRYLAADRYQTAGSDVNLLDEIGDDTFSFAPKKLSADRMYSGIATVERCLETLRRCTPELHEETLTLTQRICLYEIDCLPNGSTMYSGSKLDYLGCVFLNSDMREQPWYFWADKIVHEAAHQVLLSIMLEEEVVLNPDDERYKSPLRTEGRTVTGIYHAAFVIYRIIYFFDAVLQKKAVSDEEAAGINQSLVDYIRKFHDANEVVKTHGKLTPYGEKLIERCEAAVRGFEQTYDQAFV